MSKCAEFQKMFVTNGGTPTEPESPPVRDGRRLHMTCYGTHVFLQRPVLLQYHDDPAHAVSASSRLKDDRALAHWAQNIDVCHVLNVPHTFKFTEDELCDFLFQCVFVESMQHSVCQSTCLEEDVNTLTNDPRHNADALAVRAWAMARDNLAMFSR